MGLLDKIKDLFVDEVIEDEEVEVEEPASKKIYEEPKNELPKVMRETISKTEKKEETPNLDFSFDELKGAKPKKEFVPEEKPKESVPTTQPKFSFPIDLEEDYKPLKRNNVNILELEKEKKVEPPKEMPKPLYPEKEDITKKSKFRASPVISPVYGILDKNYKKEEVVEREEKDVSMKRPSKKVDFETVRKKAFGNLTDELKDNILCENCELYKEAQRINELKEDDLLYDMTIDSEKETPMTIEKAYDNYEEFGVAYQKEVSKEENIIVNHNEESAVASKVEIKEPTKEEALPSREEKNKVSIPKQEEPKEEKVDADFFELIDSMYKERNEDE